jgi:hypothetical protein
MYEVYAFLAMFTAQIVLLTVLHPMKLIGRVRAQLTRYPPERFPQLYPRGAASIERQLTLHRLLNAAIALVGLALLGWFYSYMQRADWNDGPVETLIGVFFMLQLVPVLLFMWATARTNTLIRSSLREETRKAVLERRGLFDFISPFLVFTTLMCYPLFVAFVLYIGRNPFPGFAGVPVNIAIVTTLYAVISACVYAVLHSKKANPLQTHADRMRTIELAVKLCVYSCLASVAFLSLNFTLVLLDLQHWEPLDQSAFLVTCAVLYLKGLAGLNGPPGELDLERLHSKTV